MFIVNDDVIKTFLRLINKLGAGRILGFLLASEHTVPMLACYKLRELMNHISEQSSELTFRIHAKAPRSSIFFYNTALLPVW